MDRSYLCYLSEVGNTMIIYSDVAATLPKREVRDKVCELRIVGATNSEKNNLLKKERSLFFNCVSPFNKYTARYMNAKTNEYGIYTSEKGLMNYIRVLNEKNYTLVYKEFESEYQVRLKLDGKFIAKFRGFKRDPMYGEKYLKFQKRIVRDFPGTDNLFSTDLPKLGGAINLDEFNNYFS